MKLIIASDIHGSAYWCRRMLDVFYRENPERLILLGDLLYHGPRNDLPRDYAPKEVIRELNAVKDRILCVRGNCEAEVDQMVLEFPVMSEMMVLFVEGRTIYATHGHLHGRHNPPLLQKGDILLHGHTHIQAMEDTGDFLYLNPGSVSIPKGGNENSCMIYENKEISLLSLVTGEKIGKCRL